MGDELVEAVERDAVTAGRERLGGVRHGRVVADRLGVALGVAAAVVEPVDPQRLEVGGQRVDLAQEVGGGEPALAERVRRRVRGGGDAGAARHELAEEAGHEHGVARVVELELVDADEPRPAQQLDRLRVAERADERRVLDEGAEVLRPVRDVPERGEEVGLADAEPAVEVDARELDARGPLAGEEPARPLRRAPGAGELVEPVEGRLLRREVGVGPVRFEGGVLELRRRRRARTRSRRPRSSGSARRGGSGHGSRPWSCWRVSRIAPDDGHADFHPHAA